MLLAKGIHSLQVGWYGAKLLVIFEDFGGDFGGENVQLEYGLDCFALFPFTISTSSATQKTSKPLAEADAKSTTLNSTSIYIYICVVQCPVCMVLKGQYP